MNKKVNDSRGSVRNDTVEPLSVVVSPNTRLFQSAEIFADTREVIIDHEGEHYRLRSTRKGKLILTK